MSFGSSTFPQSQDKVITYALFTYNHEYWIEEALQSALSQDYETLEIFVVDDASRDGTNQVIYETLTEYSGPHSVTYIKGAKNIGKVARLNQITFLMTGALLVVADGDDISVNNRVSVVFEKWEKLGFPKNVLIHSGRELISRDLNLNKLVQGMPKEAFVCIEEYAKCPRALIYGCTISFTPNLIRLYGPLAEGTFIEDLQLTFRALVFGRVLGINLPLVRYRMHESNISREITLQEESRWLNYIERFKVVIDQNMRDTSFLDSQELAVTLNERLSVAHAAYSRSTLLIRKGGAYNKARFLFEYPGVTGLKYRINFILRQLGLGDSGPYKLIFRIWRRFFKRGCV